MANVEIDLENEEIKHKNRKVKVENIMHELRKRGVHGIISGNKMYVQVKDVEEFFRLFEKGAKKEIAYTYKELVAIAKKHGIKTKGKRKVELMKELKKKGAI